MTGECWGCCFSLRGVNKDLTDKWMFKQRLEGSKGLGRVVENRDCQDVCLASSRAWEEATWLHWSEQGEVAGGEVRETEVGELVGYGELLGFSGYLMSFG